MSQSIASSDARRLRNNSETRVSMVSRQAFFLDSRGDYRIVDRQTRPWLLHLQICFKKRLSETEAAQNRDCFVSEGIGVDRTGLIATEKVYPNSYLMVATWATISDRYMFVCWHCCTCKPHSYGVLCRTTKPPPWAHVSVWPQILLQAALLSCAESGSSLSHVLLGFAETLRRRIRSICGLWKGHCRNVKISGKIQEKTE